MQKREEKKKVEWVRASHDICEIMYECAFCLISAKTIRKAKGGIGEYHMAHAGI